MYQKLLNKWMQDPKYINALTNMKAKRSHRKFQLEKNGKIAATK